MPKTVEELEKELSTLTESSKKEKESLETKLKELEAQLEVDDPVPTPKPRPARVPGNSADITFVSRKEWDDFKAKQPNLFTEPAAPPKPSASKKSFGELIYETVFGPLTSSK
jgi:hypothetical protein